MPDADARAPLPGAIPIRPEGEPHLTFQALLSDTLHEMDADETAGTPEPDAAATLCDDAVAALRSGNAAPFVRPFHHTYLTPMSSPAFLPRPTRLDIRS